MHCSTWPISNPPLILGDLVACSIDTSDGAYRGHSILELLLGAIRLVCQVSIGTAHFIILGSMLIKFKPQLLIDNIALLWHLPISFGLLLLVKRFIVSRILRRVGHDLRGAQRITVFHAIDLIIGANNELAACCYNSSLCLLLRRLAQARSSCSEISLLLACLDRRKWILDLLLLPVHWLLIVHIAVSLLVVVLVWDRCANYGIIWSHRIWSIVHGH